MRFIYIIILAFMISNCSEGIENPASNNPRVPSDTSDSTSTSPDSTSISMDSALTFLALGDSYTIGESVPENERWYLQLAEALKEESIFISKADVIARTGWTTAELIDAIERSGNNKKYSMVSLLIGVNNQYRGQDTETYRKEFGELLEIAGDYAGSNRSNVIVLSIPDWGVTPFAEAQNVDSEKVSSEIDAFNAVAKQECGKIGITFVNITDISRKAKNEANYIADDGLHFSGEMYELWAIETLPYAKKVLKK